jgi:hypothetical protein
VLGDLSIRILIRRRVSFVPDLGHRIFDAHRNPTTADQLETVSRQAMARLYIAQTFGG